MPDEPYPAFRKIPRWNRGFTITEKIDGTNGLIHIDDNDLMRVGSRNRWLGLGKGEDNYGFAAWCMENHDTLVRDLGPGHHYGEWWGKGIQRSYGLDHKRFSLFNTVRWEDVPFETPNLGVVPVIDSLRDEQVDFTFSAHAAAGHALDLLHLAGSVAAPGFKKPEGIVIYHNASRHLYKITLDNDGIPKSKAAT